MRTLEQAWQRTEEEHLRLSKAIFDHHELPKEERESPEHQANIKAIRKECVNLHLLRIQIVIDMKAEEKHDRTQHHVP